MTQTTDTDVAAARRRPLRVGDSVLWALGTAALLTIAATLSQIRTWGLWAGVVLTLATAGIAAIRVGGVWHRAGAATLTAVFGGAAVLFAGPAAYEVYMQSVGEPARASVADIYDVEGEIRECTVVELGGDKATHVLDQRSNCFDHIRRGEVVTLYQDPLGALPPRLEDPPDGIGVTTTVTIAAALLVAAGGSVLYGGLRRRDAGELPARKPPEPRRDVVWLDTDAGPGGPTGTQPPAHMVMPVVRATGADGVTTAVGFADRSEHGLVLWRDAGRTEEFARVVAVPASTRRTAQFVVTDSGGRPVAAISRRRAGWLPIRRTRWIIRQEGRPEAVGRKGSPGWWLVWWVTWPLQLVFVPIVFVISVVTLSDALEPVRSPLRTKWRIDGEIVLEYRTGGTAGGPAKDHLHALATWWDPRLTVALTALVRRYDSWFGDRWGGRRPGRNP